MAGDLAAVRAVVSAMDPSAATALVNHAASGRNTLLFKVQGSAKLHLPGFVNYVPAIFCLNLPATFSQPGNGNLAKHSLLNI